MKWSFKDGTELEVKQEEHSSLNHFITYGIITAKPELTYTSSVSTIRCYPVTSGEAEGKFNGSSLSLAPCLLTDPLVTCRQHLRRMDRQLLQRCRRRRDPRREIQAP